MSTSTDKGHVVDNRTFRVVDSEVSLTYRVGEPININFEAVNGRRPYFWTFTNLPPGLIASMSG